MTDDEEVSYRNLWRALKAWEPYAPWGKARENFGMMNVAGKSRAQVLRMQADQAEAEERAFTELHAAIKDMRQREEV